MASNEKNTDRLQDHITAEVKRLEENMSARFDGVNGRLDKLESLRERVVIVETVQENCTKDVGDLLIFKEKITQFMASLGFKTSFYLVTIIMSLVSAIFGLYSIRINQQEITQREQLVEELKQYRSGSPPLSTEKTASQNTNETLYQIHE